MNRLSTFALSIDRLPVHTSANGPALHQQPGPWPKPYEEVPT